MVMGLLQKVAGRRAPGKARTDVSSLWGSSAFLLREVVGARRTVLVDNVIHKYLLNVYCAPVTASTMAINMSGRTCFLLSELPSDVFRQGTRQ